MGDETDGRLARLRRAMARMQRQGRTREFEALSAAYADLKAQRMELVEREQREAARARRAQQRAWEWVELEVWRLPRGFGRSPLARERDRLPGREEAGMPAGGLSPWRRGHPMSERIDGG